MRRIASSPRFLLTLFLLAGLFFGAAGGAVARESSSPGAQACPNPIVMWTFDDGTVNPSVGTGTLTWPEPPVRQIDFLDRTTDGSDKAVGYDQWELGYNENKYIEFRVDTTGRNAIQLLFETKSATKGPFEFILKYSADGTNFRALNPQRMGPAWYPQAFDFRTIKGLENNPHARFRLYAYMSADINAEWYLDNVEFRGGCAIYFDPTPTATPNPSLNAVISEVAWMGTLDSSADEWIELYNPTSTTIDLTNWTLKLLNDSKQETAAVSLNGTIDSAQYYLLAKHADDIKDGNGNNVTPNVILPSSFTMGNTSGSRTLALYDSSGTLVDTANYNGGAWPAGSSSENCGFGSMERINASLRDSDTNWVTNTADYTWNRYDSRGNGSTNYRIRGTPGSRNWIFISPLIAPLTPYATRSVVVSEVAWSGTVASSVDEWIELQNATSQDIDLRGWSLRADDGTPTIALDGTIARFGLDDSFFLIEHASFNAVLYNPDPAEDDLAYELGCTTASLSDSGEILRLYDPANNVIDTANGNGGSWPAGRTTNRLSMERRGPNFADNDTAWITNTGVQRNGRDRQNNPINGTPRRPNWAFVVTPTPLPGGGVATNTPAARAGPVLVLNEVLPRPGTDWNNDGKVDVYDEFIEVMNAGTVDLNLSAYKLDDYELDASGKVISNAFTLPNRTLKPGEKAVFYGSQTGILLDDSGDTVRLLRASNNAVLDAVTYPLVKSLDFSICRYADGYGLWIVGCYPTPGLPNSLAGGDAPLPATGGGAVVACPLPDSTPEEFVLAECEEGGLGIWNPSYWDSFPGEGDEIWRSDEKDKWPVIYE